MIVGRCHLSLRSIRGDAFHQAVRSLRSQLVKYRSSSPSSSLFSVTREFFVVVGGRFLLSLNIVYYPVPPPLASETLLQPCAFFAEPPPKKTYFFCFSLARPNPMSDRWLRRAKGCNFGGCLRFLHGDTPLFFVGVCDLWHDVPQLTNYIGHLSNYVPSLSRRTAVRRYAHSRAMISSQL